MARFDLTDFEWSVIEPLLPTKVRSGSAVDKSVCLDKLDTSKNANLGVTLRRVLTTEARFSGIVG